MISTAELGLEVHKKRKEEGYSLRAAADEMGVSHSALNRLELGMNVRSEVVLAALRWCGLDVEVADA